MEMKRGIFLIFIFIIFIGFVSANTNTSLEIGNTAPVLIKNISDFAWAPGSSYQNVFDLDDYFEDFQGDNLTYSSVSPENITVSVSEGGIVSFYPDVFFSGNRSVIFQASDGVFTTDSNIVSLKVGGDTQAPLWFNVSKDKDTIYQSYYVTFSSIWTDDYQLKDYSFQINQGSGWNFYNSSFSGISNSSLKKLQMSAIGGTRIYWKFCAKDISQNQNCTPIYNFTLNSRNLTSILSGPSSNTGSGGGSSGSGRSGGSSSGSFSIYSSSLFGNFASSISSFLSNKKEDNFELSIKDFVLSLIQGSEETKVFEIINTGDTFLNFSLEFQSYEKFGFLSDNFFSLEPGEKKIVTIDFRASDSLEPGEYYGNLLIKSSRWVNVPVTLYVNPRNLSFDVNVSLIDKTVRPGQEIEAAIKIIPLNLNKGSESVFYYAIKDFQGNIYDSGEEELFVGGTISLNKILHLSQEDQVGNYIFYARVSDDDVFSIGFDDFEYGVKFSFAAFLKSSLVFLSIFIFSFILLFLVMRYNRQKQREKLFNLYISLNEMKKLIKEKKYDSAADLYLKIKNSYGEHVSKNILKDKESLINSIKEFSNKFDFESVKEQERKLEDKKEKESGNKDFKEEKLEENINKKEKKIKEAKDKKSKEDNKRNKQKAEKGKKEISKEEEKDFKEEKSNEEFKGNIKKEMKEIPKEENENENEKYKDKNKEAETEGVKEEINKKFFENKKEKISKEVRNEEK